MFLVLDLLTELESGSNSWARVPMVAKVGGGLSTLAQRWQANPLPEMVGKCLGNGIKNKNNIEIYSSFKTLEKAYPCFLK